jgi:hypothetical protein
LRLFWGVVAVAVLASCSLGEKQDIADRASGAREVDRGSRAAVVSLAIRPLKLPTGVAEGGEAMAAASAGLYAAAPAAVDIAAGRSVLLAPPTAAARIAALTGSAPMEPAALVFTDRETTIVRRPAREVVAARAWYVLELDRAKEVTKPTTSVALTSRNPSDLAVLTPTLMVDLLAGVLAGSVTQRGSEITGRLSIDKANREDDLDDDAIEARTEAFRLFAITDDVHDFRLVVGEDGALEELEIRLKMKPDKQSSIELTWSIDVQDPLAELARPARDQGIRISSFAQARGAITAWTAQ